MNSALPVDPAAAISEATSADLIRRKLDMDALRKRLGDQSTKEEKLRESCEGFEAIFLQKMWEQMRKTVPKEGYLHSKDEETYQSLFDIELCKKMASAGGIGLADMLYEQLSQQLENTGRTTTPSTYRRPLDIEPSGSLMAAASAAVPARVPNSTAQAPLKAEDLYSPLPPLPPLPEEDSQPDEPEQNSPDAVRGALEELRAELDNSGQAVREWAEARAGATGAPIAASVATGPVMGAEAAPAFTGGAGVTESKRGGAPAPAAENPGGAGTEAAAASADSASTTSTSSAASSASGTSSAASSASGTSSAASESVSSAATSAANEAGALQAGALQVQDQTQTQATALAEAADRARENGIDPAQLSWQGAGPVSARPKPLQHFGRDRTVGETRGQSRAAAQPRGMAPEETLWPLSDSASPVLSRFGWEDDPASGKRHWNAGVKISAAAQSPVRAVLPGTVVYAGQREGSGHTVVLEHRDGFRSYYGRLEPGSVKVGDKIRAGAEFAKIAAEPLSPGNEEKSAFLHFELKKGEMALNPESAINRNAG